MKMFAGHRWSFILVLVTVLCMSCSEQAPQPLFTFAYLTDIHVQPERSAAQGFQKTIQTVNALKPDLIVTGGDLIMDALGQTHGRADSLYQLYKELSMKLSAPVYNTMGNHEVFGLYERSGIDPDDPDYGKAMYQRQMGMEETYYSFDHEGWHFIILDGIGFTETRRYFGHIDSVQLDWLAKDLLKVGPEVPIIMSTHIPLVSVVPQLEQGTQKLVGAGYLITNVNEVMDVIKDYNVKLVLQGHLHHLEEIRVRGIDFVTAGAVSARWWTGPNQGMEEGFMMVKVFEDHVTWEYVDSGWVVEKKD